jgi:PBP1b-binding outer membrane lipoprotein LpoB
MKLQYALKVATLTMLLASCKKEADAATEAKPVPQQTVIAPIKTKESTLNFIEAFMAKKKQVKAKLSSLSPDEANVLYETYKK